MLIDWRARGPEAGGLLIKRALLALAISQRQPRPPIPAAPTAETGKAFRQAEISALFLIGMCRTSRRGPCGSWVLTARAANLVGSAELQGCSALAGDESSRTRLDGDEPGWGKLKTCQHDPG